MTTLTSSVTASQRNHSANILPTQTLMWRTRVHNLVSLTGLLPGIDVVDIFDLPNDNLHCATEIFSNTTTRDHTRVSEVLAWVVGLQTLTLGYTRDLGLARNEWLVLPILRRCGAF